MAEGEKEPITGWNAGSWFNGLISAAKEQTGKVLEVVSNDLVEFTSTMQQDAKTAVEKTKETLKQGNDSDTTNSTADMVKQSFHSFMSGITKALTVEPDEEKPSQARVPRETTELFDRAKARLRAVQVDTGTYLNEPTGPSESYADWLKSFDIETRKGEISDLLVTMVEVRSLYTSLVPSEVSHQDFWRRYFYKLHQLEVDEARKQALMKRAERANVKEDSVGWDEEEWSGDESPKLSPNKQNESATTEGTGVNPEIVETRLEPVTEQETNALAKSEPDKSMDSNKLKDTKQTLTEIKKPESHDKQKAPDNINDSVNLNDKKEADNEKADIEEKARAVIQEDNSTGSDAVVETTADDSKDSPKKEPGTTEETKDKNVTQPSEDELGKTSEVKAIDKTDDGVKVTCDKDKTNVPVVKAVEENADNVPSKSAEPVVKKEAMVDDAENQLKTKVKGDMVVVGDRESPSSDSSGNKESITEDWEQDFDVEITAEDLAAASELAQKLNMSASDYSKITGEEEDDWESWD